MESSVIKIDQFEGSLPARPLYIYLPPGYEQNHDLLYPVLYMHDGQNCFETYSGDSFAGSWQADIVADRLIQENEIEPCIIVGVGHGSEERIAEYLPPFAAFPAREKVEPEGDDPIQGRADQTAHYYINEVAPYIESNYRARSDRGGRALCGSSMGGLFTLYLALDYHDFARHYAAMSTSFWITRRPDNKIEMIERMKGRAWHDIRLWLDSGTYASPGLGNDGQTETLWAKNSLMATGKAIGPDFQHFIDIGAPHSESAWSNRLDKVLIFLFPVKGGQ